MKWEGKQVLFSAADLQVLMQARFRPDEVPDMEEVKEGLPPLWSPLSYTLWKCHGETSRKNLWRQHREALLMAKSGSGYYHHMLVRKNGGSGVRRISVPCYELRDHQRFIYKNLLSRLPLSPRACAYRKGVPLRRCAEPHCGAEVLVHLDIRDFFPSITEEKVSFALHRATGYEEELCDFLAGLCCEGGRLPQGAVTSPALSNLVMAGMDGTFGAMAAMLGFTYTRYADDIYLSSSDRSADAARIVKLARDFLRSEGFELNRDKTRIIRQGRHMAVLGLSVNEKVQVSRRYRREVRQKLHYLKRYGADAQGVQEAGGQEPYALHLLGKVGYILQVNPMDQQALRARLELLTGLHRLHRGMPFWWSA